MTKRGEPASRCLVAPSVGGSRFVGDPVDIVTGALVDQEVDFRLPRAAIALSWVRRFDSRQVGNERGLGLGFRHELDRELRFDLNGLSYIDAAWERTSFPYLQRDGQQTREGTIRLERVDAMRYRVHEPEDRSFEFAFATPDEPARLERVLERERSLSLFYERVAGRELLSGVGLGMLGRLRLTWSEARICSIALLETEPERETVLVTYRYDERGCLIEARNAYKHSLRYSFDSQLRLVHKTDRRGYTFSFDYDADGRCIQSRGEDGAEDVTLQYIPVERTTLVTRHDSGSWRYQYNDVGTVTHILDPYDGMQAFVLDAAGRVVEEIDPLGNTARIRYDARGVAAERVDDFGHVTPLPEDPALLHPLEHRVPITALEWEYGTLFEAPARLPVTGDPLWDVPFQARPLIQTSEPEWGGHTHLERSLQGLPARELREDGKSRRWMFDENANIRKQVDFEGHARSFEYVSDNHLAREIDALGRITSFEHSASEQLTAITDAGGTRSEYVLDKKDRIAEVRRHGKVRERYVYDLADNLVEKRNAAGEVLLEQTIGAGNRKVARRLGSGELQTFGYDERGRLVEARGAAGNCRFSYVYDGARTADLRAERGVEHALDAAGTRSTTVLGRFTTRYYQRSASQVTVVDPTGRTHTLGQLSAGVFQRKLSFGAREISQFDVTGRCLAKALYRCFEDDQPWLRGFRYSGEGDLIERSDNERGTTRFLHDAVHRLQRVIHPNKRADVYEYDAADNLVRLPSSHKPLRELGEGERFDIDSGNRIRATGGERIDYDDRDHIYRRELGNRATHYRRDSLDQLLEIRAPECHVVAKYDPLGRRIEKTVNGATTTYYWDTDRLAAEVFANGTCRIYVYPAPLALVPLLFVDYASVDAAPESGAVFFVFGNHLGAVEQVLNQDGQSVWQAQLDPYGLAHIETRAPFHQPLRFPGHLFDSETGLHYNRFRYYDPKLARYLESDPVGIEGGINLYAYTSNPLREVDVRGLSAKCPNGKDCPQKRRREEEDPRGPEGGRYPLALRQPPQGAPAAIAAMSGNHPSQIAARRAIAADYYKRHNPNISPADLDSNLEGINFNHPVRIVRIPPDGAGPGGAVMYQYSFPGRAPGQYFAADPDVSPTELGVNGRVRLDPDGNTPPRIVPRERRAYSVAEDHPVESLRSTAAPIQDKWSISGQPEMTKGGGEQSVITKEQHVALTQTTRD